MLRLAAAVLFCLALAHPQDAKPEGSLTANPVYEKNCAKCHGKTAEGRFMAGPSLVSGKAAAMSADDPSQHHYKRQAPHAEVRRKAFVG